MYIHRNFTHPGGVSPMKQEKVEEGEVKEEKKKGFDFSKKKDYSGTTPTSEAITNFVTPQNNLELGLEFIGGGVGVGIGKGVSKLAKTKVGKKLISKLPWLSKLTKPVTKAPKNKGFDFAGGKGKTNPKEFNFTGNKPKGGVGGDDLTTTQPFPENIPNDDMLKIQQDAFESSTMPKFNKLVDNVADYRAGGTISKPQNLADNMVFGERLEHITDSKITDDWMFPGGITKKGNKYFDAHGIEIPLDPKVDYVPPGLRR